MKMTNKARPLKQPGPPGSTVDDEYRKPMDDEDVVLADGGAMYVGTKIEDSAQFLRAVDAATAAGTSEPVLDTVAVGDRTTVSIKEVFGGGGRHVGADGRKYKNVNCEKFTAEVKRLVDEGTINEVQLMLMVCSMAYIHMLARWLL